MIEKTYSPESVENRWVEAWKEARLFHSTPGGKRAYTIVIPPPNVTGALHIGHALNNTLQDVLVRYRRLLGREACWVPGTDHGGIATQNVMEKQLKAEDKTRHSVGRERFLDLMQGWTRDCKKTILGQLTRLGCGLDFSREAFTMDAPRAKAVYHAFGEFYRKGLIYRGERMVNWCVRCGTALSDIEVEYEERKGHLWNIRYPLEDDPRRTVTVATTRPETMLGDTAVAVNPKDSRYKDLVGKTLRLPLQDRPIPVIADEHVDPEFGTGAVKVTPCHDLNDFDIWRRHLDALPEPPKVIGFSGKMTEAAGKSYAGLSREKCRGQVVADLGELAGADGEPLLEKTESYHNKVGVCYRCSSAIEPLMSEQWFMKMEPLAELALRALEEHQHRIYPESWEKPYRDWLKNIRDWCLSRQIWWGHRIPVWYCADCLGGSLRASMPKEGGGTRSATVREILDAGGSLEALAEEGGYRYVSGGDAPPDGALVMGAERPGPCACCGGGRWLQEQDVLDTWFSSALWPMSVFGWPDQTGDLDFYYPTDVLVTGHEILYLWVARMQMTGLFFKGEVPFSHTLIHGIVRDKRGKKMSKSLGNVIDPLVMMEKFGTDAFRFALASQAYPGKDIPFAEDSIIGPRNFANKLWNSSRFVLMNLSEGGGPEAPLADLDRKTLSLSDRWILSEFSLTLERVRGSMEGYGLAAAADELYGFLWDKFCDWYVELAKLDLADPERAPAVRSILVHVLDGTLRMLHPFMPFITEELCAALKPFTGSRARHILEGGVPEPGDWTDADAGGRMGAVMDAVGSLRALRAHLNVPPGLKIDVLYAGGDGDAEILEAHGGYIRHLAKLEKLEPASSGRPPQSATAVSRTLSFFVPLTGIIDLDQERKRLKKEAQRLQGELAKCEKQLGNKNFVERAPESEVAKVRARQDEARAQHSNIMDTLKSLGA